MDFERKYSVVDELTQEQIQAWGMENSALIADANGEDIAASYYRAFARELRQTDWQNKKTVVFEKLDRQNSLLDSIASIQAKGEIFNPYPLKRELHSQ